MGFPVTLYRDGQAWDVHDAIGLGIAQRDGWTATPSEAFAGLPEASQPFAGVPEEAQPSNLPRKRGRPRKVQA